MRSAEAAGEAVWLRSVRFRRQEAEVALKFLVKAGLVNDDHNALINLKAEEIPYVALAALSTTRESRTTAAPARVANARR